MTVISMARSASGTGNLIVVNAHHKITARAAQRGELVPARSPHAPACAAKARRQCKTLLPRPVAAHLHELVEQVGGWGAIEAVSGWRSREEQAALWSTSVRDNGLDFTRSYVAQPDCSEHQTGLAIDLGYTANGTPDFIRPDFPYTGICQKFRDRAAEHGFVERYPAGKEAVTGVAHEPWHFRYVGHPHASIMTERGLVLEEYIDLLGDHPARDRALVWEAPGHIWRIWRIPASTGALTAIDVQDGLPHSISGDNCGGFVVTERA